MIRLTSGAVGLLFACIVILSFSMGASAGANAAYNESQSISNTTAELNEIPRNISQNVTENATGVTKHITNAYMDYVAMPMVYSSIFAAKQGLYLGHSYPILGPVASYLGPLSALGLVSYGTYKQVQKIRRQQQ